MRQTPEQVERLADAMWQLLDDMRKDGQCACLLAIAKARLAYEPFQSDDPEDNADLMPLEYAREVVARN